MKALITIDIMTFSKLILGCYILLLTAQTAFQKLRIKRLFPEGVFSFSPVLFRALGSPAQNYSTANMCLALCSNLLVKYSSFFLKNITELLFKVLSFYSNELQTKFRGLPETAKA